MQVILNKNSCGGNAYKKWMRIYKKLNLNNGTTELFYVENKESQKDFLINALNRGKTDFIVAGGDGTINHFVNDVINLNVPEIFKEIRIGAVGIGSSNDFHKPFKFRNFQNGIPYKLNFKDAVHRDVGSLVFNEGKQSVKKYFLINASIGITANANNFFNNPDSILRFLKKFNTQTAISYTAVKNILTYKNIFAEISSNNKIFDAHISNMGIIKSPFFTGKLRYPSTPLLNNGLFDVHLYSSLKKSELLELFYSLSSRTPDNCFNKKFWRTERIIIKSEEEFAVEFDGEVITTKSVEFYVIPRLIKVCTN